MVHSSYTHMRRIELEYRSLITEAKYHDLTTFLTAHAADLGQDDKNVYFFPLPDKLLKVVHNKSQRSARIVLKLNKIGLGNDFEEMEIPIAPGEVQEIR